MNTKYIVLTVVFLLSIGCVAFADRPLDRAEILQIFEELTSQPKRTWLPAGTIEATHEEYRAPKTTEANEINSQINEEITEYLNDSDKRELTEDLQKMRLDAIPFNVRYRLANEYAMISSVVVRFDGDRFYWEINVDSRTDSAEPGADLEGNFITDQFDLNWNARRIFVWDGEEYTTYFLPGNHATVDSTGSTPHVVNGPLTAGVIPWGHGYYTYENLSVTESSAVEKYIDGQAQIHLTLNNSDGSEMLFVMDPGKDYAAISCLITDPMNVVVSKQYSNYQLVSGYWVPAKILIERYDARTNRMLTYDLWNLRGINADAPGPGDFDVEYEPDALIEYRSCVTDKAVMYRYSEMVDTDALLVERLTVAASEGTQAQNCATISLRYVASQLGKDVTDEQLAELISGPNETTSLYEMRQFVQGLGLFCRAVKTDLQTLKNLSGCKLILHIPGKKHFVVLSHIDNEYVWYIDLANNECYYRTDLSFFDMDWSEGTALLISDQPIQLQDNITEIADARLHDITGGSGYTCTRLLQECLVIYCEYFAGECWGRYQVYYERWGCEAAESGSCSSSVMIRYKKSPCIEDPYDPYQCTITGEWTCYYMRACK